MEKFSFLAILYILLNYKVISKNNTSNIIEASTSSEINYKQGIDINKTKEKELNNFNKNVIPPNTNLNYKFPNKKNLIIGAIINDNWKNISLFFKSYEKVGFENCDCVMFVTKISQDTFDKIKSCGVNIYKIPNKFKNTNINNSKWKIYENFLNDHLGKYNLVFTADIRNVFFQNDIFKFYENRNSFLGVALEDATLTEENNKQWIINAYGEYLYKTIEHERIINIGTIWGTADKFCEFSKIMWEKLNSKWSLRINVVEQAVGNFIIHHDKMFRNCIVKTENKDGHVMVIGKRNIERIKYDSENNILNNKKEIVSVIEYSKYPDIINKIIDKYYPDYRNIPETKEASKNSIIYIIPFSIFLIIIFIIIFLYIYQSKLKTKNKFDNKSMENSHLDINIYNKEKEKTYYLNNTSINLYNS